MIKIITIGVYGSNKESFFQALQDAHVDVFCDIRRRRGVRGSEYSFVNSKRLQEELHAIGIRYVHIKDLAPSQEIREKQKDNDEILGIAKRSRQNLSQAFVQAYETSCLSCFSTENFFDMIGANVKTVALFCVERKPEACHRSLAASHLSRSIGVPIEHLMPSVVS